jgi:diguanylate cyclase (GGDEF)-like protein
VQDSGDQNLVLAWSSGIGQMLLASALWLLQKRTGQRFLNYWALAGLFSAVYWGITAAELSGPLTLIPVFLAAIYIAAGTPYAAGLRPIPPSWVRWTAISLVALSFAVFGIGTKVQTLADSMSERLIILPALMLMVAAVYPLLPRALPSWPGRVFGLLLFGRAGMFIVTAPFMNLDIPYTATVQPVLDLMILGTALLWTLDRLTMGEDAQVSAVKDHNLYDNLTGLPNRHLLERRLQELLPAAERDHIPVGVFVMAIDRFKLVNDSLGRSAGDRVLRALASRLEKATRTDDLVARLEGDLFSICLPGVKPTIGGHTVSEKLLHVIQQPFKVDEVEIVLSASIGAAFFPTDAEDPDTLLANAETASDKVKSKGGSGFRAYKPEMETDTTTQLRLEIDLRRATDKSEFDIFYQPILDVRTGKIAMLEALLRWPHKSRGMLTPDSFLGVAHSLGLGARIDEWVLRTATQQVQTWRQSIGCDIGIAVNLSADPFQQADLPERVDAILKQTGLPHGALELEITEHQAMQDLEAGLTSLRKLQALGIKLAIDDFGTGYSSFSHLKTLPVHKIKIDRSFVRDILTDRGDAAIVAALISLAHSLDLVVVAEGVEEEAQAQRLRDLACDQLQGYHLHRPMPAPRVQELLQAGF